MPQKTSQKPKASDEIWKILKETSKIQKEVSKIQKEVSKLQKDVSKNQEETDRRIKETSAQQKETEKQIQETSKSLKAAQNIFSNQWGRLVESLVEGNLVDQLQERGVTVDVLYPNAKIYERRPDGQGNLVKETVCEIDLLAENGEEKAAVEVKTYLSLKDVDEYLDVLSRNAPALSGPAKKKLLAGMAFLRVQKGADIYAQRKGLFTIKVSGDNAKITNRAAFKPKNFFGAPSAPPSPAAKKRASRQKN